jgi:CRP/FNR family transcriptional regulator
MNLSRRYSKLGYSSTEFNLLMTREEIGSYLGLKLETVSRFFSHLQEKEAIKVQGRSIKIINKKKLQELCNQN